MNIEEIDCLCIKSIDYKDNDKLITLYGSGRGKFIAIAKGCKKPKAKLKFATYPFCFAKYYFNQKGERFTLTGCDCIDSFFCLSEDIEKYYGAMVVMEILDKTQLEGVYEHRLFIASLQTLKDMAYGNKCVEEVILSYLQDVIAVLGYSFSATSLREIYYYLKNTHDITIISLQELIKIQM